MLVNSWFSARPAMCGSTVCAWVTNPKISFRLMSTIASNADQNYMSSYSSMSDRIFATFCADF